MEHDFSFFSSTLFALFIFVFMILKIGWGFKTTDRTLNLPPGPWKLPIIGNLHQLVGSPPHRKLRDLAKKYGPLMHLRMGEISTIVVSSPHLAKEVMKTHDVIFASRPQVAAAKAIFYDGTDILFSPCGNYWSQLRKICRSELLSLKRVRSFQSVREEELNNLVNWIDSKAGTEINLTDRVYSLMYGVTAKAAFGSKCKDQELFVSAVEEITQLIASIDIADLFPSIGLLQSVSGNRSRMERVHKVADRIIENIINEHKLRRATLKIGKSEDDDHGDLVDVLLKFQDHGDHEFPLTTDNIKAVITDVFAAASETVATTVNWAMCEMMKNPEVMKKAQAEVREFYRRQGKVDETDINEMNYLKLVIKETLRLHPPAPFLFPRECGQRCEINGFTIPMKARVLVNAWAIARDPEYWNEPESFFPERFDDSSVDYKGNNFEYIPFGAGRRICPGILYGVANVELALAMLLCHFDWRLPEGMKHEDFDMSETSGASAKRKDDLCVIPIPYNPSRPE